MLLGITCRDEEMWSLFLLVSCVDKIRLESCIYPRLLKYHFSDSWTKVRLLRQTGICKLEESRLLLW